MHKYTYLIISCLLLTSCATAPVSSTTQNRTASSQATTEQPLKVIPVKERQAALKNVQSWQIQGKLAAKTANDSASGSVNWIKSGGAYSVTMLGPIGSGFVLKGTPGHVSLKMASGNTYVANSPEQLLAEHLKVRLPVSLLNYWIRALPAPSGASKKQFDDYGRLTSLAQAGFVITYSDYINQGGVDLPTRISLQSAGFSARIAIYNWKI